MFAIAMGWDGPILALVKLRVRNREQLKALEIFRKFLLRSLTFSFFNLKLFLYKGKKENEIRKYSFINQPTLLKQ